MFHCLCMLREDQWNLQVLFPALLESDGVPPIPSKCQAAAFSATIIPNTPLYRSSHTHTLSMARHKQINIHRRTSPLAVQAPHINKQYSHKHELYMAQSCSYWLKRCKLAHRGLSGSSPSSYVHICIQLWTYNLSSLHFVAG